MHNRVSCGLLVSIIGGLIALIGGLLTGMLSEHGIQGILTGMSTTAIGGLVAVIGGYARKMGINIIIVN